MTKEVKVIKLSQASDLAKTISNKTAQSIIEHISTVKKATATQISKKLNLPASTVHYNLKALVKGGIVDDSSFTYSEKGKTIIHYTLTNNILVIIPESQDEFSFMQSLKALVPSFLGVGVLAATYYALQTKLSTQSTALQYADTSESIPFAEIATDEMARSLPASQPVASPLIPEFIWGLLIATIIITIIFLAYKYFKSKKKK